MINNEKLITEMERRIVHHKQYRATLLDEALTLSNKNPRKSYLLDRARSFARRINALQTDLYKLYATRKV